MGPLSPKRQFLALGGFLLASLFYTYPLVTAPTRAHRLDSPDAMLNGWIVSWCLHQLPRDPTHLFDANIFFPERGSLAYSENLLTGALFASPAALFSDSPILLFNVALVLAFVATAYATFVLARDVTADGWSGALAGILFAFAPYRFAHIPHLQLELAFGIPMILYFARRTLREDDRVVGPIGLLAAIPLTFGSSVYYSVYAATALPLIAFPELRRRTRGSRFRPGLRLLLACALGTIVTLPLVLPYWSKLSAGTVRSLDAAAGFAASPLDYLSSFSWLHAFLPETAEPLFPGFVALGLAGLALVRPSSGSRISKISWLALGLLGVALSLGPKLGLFSVLYELLPPYRALRVPSRAGVLFLLSVSILAAIGLSRIRSRGARIALIGVAAAECFAGPLPFSMEVPEAPAIYEQIQALEGDGALVVLPFPPPERFQDNALYVYRSIRGFRPLVNGYSGFVPASYREVHRSLVEGELSPAIRRLSQEGVRYLLAHRGRLGPRIRRELDEAEAMGLLIELAEVPPDRLYGIRDGTSP
jgi:hypothetical protein